jgi:hypothetical protein
LEGQRVGGGEEEEEVGLMVRASGVVDRVHLLKKSMMVVEASM